MGCPGKDICKARGLRNGHDGAYENYGHGRPRSGTDYLGVIPPALLASWLSFCCCSFGLCRVTRQPVTVPQLQLERLFYRTLHTARCISVAVRKKWSIGGSFWIRSQGSALHRLLLHRSSPLQGCPATTWAFTCIQLKTLPHPSSSLPQATELQVKASSQSNIAAHCPGKKTCLLLGGPTPLALTVSILASSVAICSTTPPCSRSL